MWISKMQRPYSHTLKEQLDALDEEVENVDIVITTLKILPRSWDPFIRWMCARRKWLLSVDSGKSEHEEYQLIGTEDKQLNIKLSWFKEDPSSDEEYEGLNSWRTSYPS